MKNPNYAEIHITVDGPDDNADVHTTMTGRAPSLFAGLLAGLATIRDSFKGSDREYFTALNTELQELLDQDSAKCKQKTRIAIPWTKQS